MPTRSSHRNPSAAAECTRPVTSTSTINERGARTRTCPAAGDARSVVATGWPLVGSRGRDVGAAGEKDARGRGGMGVRAAGSRPAGASAPKRGAVVPAPLPKSRTAAVSFQHARAYLTSSPLMLVPPGPAFSWPFRRLISGVQYNTATWDLSNTPLSQSLSQ